MGDISQSLLRDIKQQVDELRVQLNLGGAEASQFLEDHRSEFEALLGLLKTRVTESSEVSDDKTQALRQKLDELRLQLKLGEMDGREAYASKRTEVEKAIGDVRSDLAPLAQSATALLGTLGVDFDHHAEKFRSKLDALGLNLGLGKIVAEEEAKLRKDEISSQLDDLSKKIEPAINNVEKSLGHFAGEVMENFEGILGRIRASL